jgi:hypothetical protein
MAEQPLTAKPGHGHNAARRAKAIELLNAQLDQYEQQNYFGRVTISVPVQNGAFAQVEDETKRVHK